MVRENRVKEYIFPAFSVNGSVISNIFTDHVLNGELLKVRIQNAQSPGSVWLVESGLTGLEMWRQNNVVSGTNATEYYPMIYAVGPTSVTGSPQAYMNQITNGILYIAGSGFTSGTEKTFGPLTVYYR
jgi:hypothetical protein